MSSDNAIVVGQFVDGYRISEVFADLLDMDAIPVDYINNQFNGPVYPTLDEAWNAAYRMEIDFEFQDHCVEYGIFEKDFRGIPGYTT